DGLSRVISGGVIWTARVGHRDVQIGTYEWEVVVAAVPDDDVRFRGDTIDDLGVVHAGEDDLTRFEVRLVFLALIHGARPRCQIGAAREAMDSLPLEIAVRHRMTATRRWCCGRRRARQRADR